MIIGHLLSERIVEDKKQVAEFDPAAWIDDQIDDIDVSPCPICGNSDEEEVLLLCDACDAPYHTHCVGLDRVPHGHWFCMECVDQGANDRASLAASNPERISRLSARQPRTFAQRTAAQVRRARHRYTPDSWQGAWSQISARVWDNLNVDLEYGDEDDTLTEFRRLQRRTDRQRRDFRQWQQRLAIASRQGAREEFEEAARPHLSAREQRAQTPKETKEEQKAWDTFNSLLEGDTISPPSKKRKRATKSRTASPQEPPTEPERKLKRPKTRRIVDRPESSSSRAESSHPKTSRESLSPRRNLAPISIEASGTAPSFLSSLLKEVEMNTPSEDEMTSVPMSINAGSPYAEMSSPAASPIASSYSTPRAMSATPPPHEKRPGSPMPLTSRVEPIYLHPDRSASEQKHSEPALNGVPEIRHPRPRKQQPTPVQRSPESSPSRSSISISAKEGISKIVRTALEPHYKKPSGITKEQYASINRLVSHMLYDKISNPESLEDEKSKTVWEKIANAEVAKAVEGLSA